MAKEKLTHCKRGHERTTENVTSNGTCRLCNNARRNTTRVSKAKAKTSRKCSWCNEEFYTSKPRQMYCCKKCSHCARQKRRRHNLPLGSPVSRKHAMPHAVCPYPEETKKERSRRTSLKMTGWTPESFATAKQVQNNRCAICNETPSKPHGQSMEQLVPDHKHGKLPVPRALLCPNCNAAIGFLKDSPERCESAAVYLRKFSQPIDAGSTVHAPGCDCGFCKMGATKF